MYITFIGAICTIIYEFTGSLISYLDSFHPGSYLGIFDERFKSKRRSDSLSSARGPNSYIVPATLCLDAEYDLH